MSVYPGPAPKPIMKPAAPVRSQASQPVASTIDMVNKFLANNLNQVQEASDSEEETKELIKPVIKSNRDAAKTEQLSECQFDITVSEQSIVAPPQKANEDLLNLADEFLSMNKE